MSFVQCVDVGAEYLSDFGFVVIDFVIADAPPECGAWPCVALDDVGAQVVFGEGGICGAQYPAVVGEDYGWGVVGGGHSYLLR